MAQLIIRNLEDSVKAKLQKRAKRNGRSMEAEVRDILRNAATQEERQTEGLGTELSRLFSGLGFKGEIPQKKIKVKPAKF
jgi:plasmid stability protein